jgi:hypothetical protein
MSTKIQVSQNLKVCKHKGHNEMQNKALHFVLFVLALSEGQAHCNLRAHCDLTSSQIPNDYVKIIAQLEKLLTSPNFTYIFPS